MNFKDYLLKIEESFEAKKKSKEAVSYKSSSLDDPNIKNAITKFSQESGISYDDIVEQINKNIQKFRDISKYSPMFHETMELNVVEDALFHLVEKFNKEKPPADPANKFDPKIFRKLINYINQEHRGALLPLRTPGEYKRIYRVNPILVPSSLPQFKQFNSVDTAAATASGEFIFNINFMNNLLYYGSIIGVKPTKNKYVSNGGDIPDNYSYIEFLILHELLHYVFGDFAYGRRFPQYSHRTHNIASDLRSNHILVKNGYTQLPIGLYSNNFNLDRDDTKTYSKLIAEVNKELEKIPKSMQAWIEEKIQDEHDPGEKTEWVPQPGEIVINKDRFVQIVSVDEHSGKVVAREISEEEVKKIYPDIKINR